MTEGKPNLFAVATSELSQDALLVWLLRWADPKCEKFDGNLHACAVHFLRFLLGESEKYGIQSVRVGRQWKGIDVWAEINDEYFLLIEDKKGTREHSNQLQRYLETAQDHYSKKGMTVVPVYFKLEEQGIWSGIDKSGYRVVLRHQFLNILKDYVDATDGKKSNDIILDYYWHLCELDRKVRGYKTVPPAQWNWHAWQGFFSAVRDEFDGEWDYVPNASGGFLGFWWEWRESKHQDCKFEFYLQLEYDKLIFKLYAYEPDCRTAIREHYRSILYTTAAEKNVNIEQYGRLGTYMGVAKLKEDYRLTDESGLLDMEATIMNIRRIQSIIDAVDGKLDRIRIRKSETDQVISG